MEEIIKLLSDHRVDHRLDAGKPDLFDTIRRRIHTIGARRLLTDSVKILRSGLYLTGDSLVHENGFKKISLYKDSVTGLQIRLHLWPEGTADASIHNHRWNFVSYVLSGEIVASNYVLEKSGDESAVELLRLSDADEQLSKQTVVLDRVKFSENNRTTISEGGMHYVGDDLMHRVTSPTGAITLMITGTPLKNHSDVIRLKNGGKSRQRMSQEESVAAILDEC